MNAKKVSKQIQPDKAQKRVFKGQQKLIHDLYKLEVAKMRKEVGYDVVNPQFEWLEHVHMYHTIDSNGRRLTHAQPIGQHWHEMKLVGAREDGMPLFECGPALRKISSHRFIEIPGDNHRHDVSYVCSEEIEQRQYNPDYMKFQSQVANHQAELTKNPEIKEG